MDYFEDRKQKITAELAQYDVGLGHAVRGVDRQNKYRTNAMKVLLSSEFINRRQIEIRHYAERVIAYVNAIERLQNDLIRLNEQEREVNKRVEFSDSVEGLRRVNDGRICQESGCRVQAVVESYIGFAATHAECADHFLEPPKHPCGVCQEMKAIVDYKSGPSLGGLGTVEIWTLECGHTDGIEDDSAANYI
jgi:hypothetical protein